MNNNKGYSLTELLLAIFVLSIVMLGIAGILRSTSQFYRNGVQEVRVQEEAQLAVNLIEEMLVDADADNASQKPSWDATTERLSFYNEDGKHINITYQHPTGDPQGQLLMGYWENPDNTGNYIVETLADYVTGFEVSGIDYDASHPNADNKIKVSVSMNNSGYEYTASKEIYMRNLVENNTISISTVPSGGGGGSTWDAEILLNRYETYNLTIAQNANPAGTISFLGDFEQYFDTTTTSDSLVVSVDAAYCTNLGASSTDACGIVIQ
ncbi:MAG: prepilin-type N-terminal cleavage/methylation domain-containing protein, partial [Lachnospiraceae bacterium]|nr:prepilin-type N-terminal cleavage/methylation domain-containing protein [Lachnospiraceae bacterium]